MNEAKSTWRYYNHAMIPAVAHHKEPDMTCLKDGSIWKSDENGTPLLARWTTDFDCGYETGWWYCIKDTPFDISSLSSNYRYKINKGCKRFDVHQIKPEEYLEELYEVQTAALSGYPEKYRPSVDKEKFRKECLKWEERFRVFGAFFRENNKLCGYTLIAEHEEYMELQVQKTDPLYEKHQINAALVANILEYYKDELTQGFYICDGERNILHETNFQEYLGKYFDFRKAYCKLNLAYNPKIKWIIKIIYPFRKILEKLDFIGIVHKLNGVLKMETFVRNS